MSIRLDKPWRPLTLEALAPLPAQLGVYQIARDEEVTLIGVADARSLFGLRGELLRELERLGPGHHFRFEVTMSYHTRHRELLMVHVADHGALPPENAANPPPSLGRLSPG